MYLQVILTYFLIALTLTNIDGVVETVDTSKWTYDQYVELLERVAEY